jgi:hypothetical protein
MAAKASGSLDQVGTVIELIDRREFGKIGKNIKAFPKDTQDKITGILKNYTIHQRSLKLRKDFPVEVRTIIKDIKSDTDELREVVVAYAAEKLALVQETDIESIRGYVFQTNLTVQEIFKMCVNLRTLNSGPRHQLSEEERLAVFELPGKVRVTGDNQQRVFYC